MTIQKSPTRTKKAAGSKSSSVSYLTRTILWAKAAGRCQYTGCNKPLIGDLISGSQNNNFGFVAHIVSDTPTGPRGDAQRSVTLANDVENLMLLCHVHHKLIDVDEIETHSEECLLAMKEGHETRVATVVDIGPERASHILRFGAQIGKHEAVFGYNGISTAMMPERYPADGRRTIDLEIRGCVYKDHELDYWKFHKENLERQFNSKVRDQIASRDIAHLSVFALAPQPLLIFLGSLLGDIIPCTVYQLQREPQTWRWSDGAAEIDFVEKRPTTTTGPIALVLALSASVSDDRVTSVLGKDASIWSLSSDQPHNNLMRTRADLSEFRRRLRTLLDQIKMSHGEDRNINVFPALPVSAAIEVGRVLMPKADLPLQVFDQNQVTGGFVSALNVTKASAATPARKYVYQAARAWPSG